MKNVGFSLPNHVHSEEYCILLSSVTLQTSITQRLAPVSAVGAEVLVFVLQSGALQQCLSPLENWEWV